MRDVVKTNVKRNQNSKRARRRRRNVPLYCFLVIILVLGIGILLSVTLFFNINKIDVKGDVDYSSEEITEFPESVMATIWSDWTQKKQQTIYLTV